VRHNPCQGRGTDIIRARVEELIRLIALELPRAEFDSLVPAGLVLTGGSSNLAGIDILGQQVLGAPVRVGRPIGIYGISDILHNPAYATSVGLVLWGLKPKSITKWKSQSFAGNFRNLFTRIRSLFR